jgi:hypothetical protein
MTGQPSRLPTFTMPVLPGAACKGRDPETWFDPAREEEAKRICSTCPARCGCLEYATTARLRGVWGGQSETERAGVKRCSHCKQERSRLDFDANRAARDGLSWWCRECRAAK